VSNLKRAWAGTLKLGFVTQPVSVYSASDSKAAKVAFNQLHSECGGRINQVTVCRACDAAKALDKSDISRGFEYEKGQYVTISDAELDDCKVENTKVIDLKEFVPVTDLSPLMIESSAFIAPQVSDMAEAYVLIREALDGQAGIGTLNHSNKEKLVAIVASGKGLILHTLRHASEIRDVLAVPLLDKLPETADAATVTMMKALMASMQSPALDLEKYPNTYVENVQAVIAAKVLAKATGTEAVIVPKAEPVKVVSNLAAMLEASLAAKNVPVEAPKAKKPRAKKLEVAA